MRSEGILKHVAAAFVIAVVFYVVTFMWIERRRVAHGPWQILFSSDGAGVPSLAISDSKLNISNTVRFVTGKTTPNISKSIEFRQDISELPFGKIAFQDPTFLPGTLSMQLFDHKVELMPRILFIDGKEYPWNLTNVVELR
ncbi:MAG TPA: hypothetical protein VGO67_02110 [Verrucomicrobiae bacterium]|jgi:hypothetical protein